MKISVSSPAFSVIPLEEFVPKVASRWRRWEMVSDGAHFLPAHVDEFRTAISSTDLDVTVHCPLSDINVASLVDDVRQLSVGRILEAIKAMRAVDLDSIVIHPGHASPIGVADWETVRRLNRDSLKVIANACREHGVEAHLENMPNFDWPLLKTPEELFPVAEELGMGVCLDTGHANTNANLVAFLEGAARVTHLHFHDNAGKKDEHLPVGEGTVDAKAVVRSLAGFDGHVVLEVKSLEAGDKARAAVERLGWRE